MSNFHNKWNSDLYKYIFNLLTIYYNYYRIYQIIQQTICCNDRPLNFGACAVIKAAEDSNFLGFPEATNIIQNMIIHYTMQQYSAFLLKNKDLKTTTYVF